MILIYCVCSSSSSSAVSFLRLLLWLLLLLLLLPQIVRVVSFLCVFLLVLLFLFLLSIDITILKCLLLPLSSAVFFSLVASYALKSFWGRLKTIHCIKQIIAEHPSIQVFVSFSNIPL